jgi:medium-chain acyl-[acyl-carrier-protein] hydrolase
MVDPLTLNPWLPELGRRPAGGLRLFCFPYAGGGASFVRSWARALPQEVSLCPVYLPGRELRLKEPLFTALPPLTKAIASALLPYLREPFAFFGHSMGALLAFELARLLRSERGIEPVSLFVSGCAAPQVARREESWTFNLPEPEFVDRLRRLNGTPQQVLDHPDLMHLMIPILRADFEISETYSYVPGDPLTCPLRVYGGLRDPDVSPEDLELWRTHSSASFSLRMFPGDHFFIHSNHSLLLAEIARELGTLLRVKTNR